ncbi:hypothetical protein DRN70_02785 [Methanosarcinales archaeon]|nr:MAG: hypothetical protein DRN70_02785 [Methanosarcinales archaeon]
MDMIRIGVILLVIGFYAMLLAFFQDTATSNDIGGVVMVGPIPIIFSRL